MAFSFHLSHFYLSSLLNNAGALGELDNLGDIAKSQARYGVGTTIVNGYATRGGVVYLGTGDLTVGMIDYDSPTQIRGKGKSCVPKGQKPPAQGSRPGI